MKNGKYEFYESKWLCTLYFIFILIAGAGLSGPILIGILNDESVRFLIFIPMLMIIVWVYLCYHCLYSCFNPKPYIIIDSQKLQYNGGYLDMGKIEREFFWNEIDSISLEFRHTKERIPSLKVSTKNHDYWIPFSTISDDDRRSILKIIQRYKRILYRNTDAGNYACYNGWLLVILIGWLLAVLAISIIAAFFS